MNPTNINLLTFISLLIGTRKTMHSIGNFMDDFKAFCWMTIASVLLYMVCVFAKNMKVSEKAVTLAIATAFYSIAFATIFYWLETPAFIILGTISAFFGVYIYFGFHKTLDEIIIPKLERMEKNEDYILATIYVEGYFFAWMGLIIFDAGKKAYLWFQTINPWAARQSN